MTEPTAEHLKAAQEWLEKRGGSLEGPLASQSYGWVEVSDENVASLAALLASRDREWQHDPSCITQTEPTYECDCRVVYQLKLEAAVRREQALREENERLRRALAPEMLDALTGQRLRAEAAEARLKRVMEVLEPALKKARGVSSIYQHRSDLAAALAAAQSSEEGA